MASQVQLANTFNEFRQAYNDAANDITTLQTANTTLQTKLFTGTGEIYGANVQIETLSNNKS